MWKIDDGFYRRLRIYLVGVILGTILSTAIFRTRGCNRWTPNNAVKNRIVYLLKNEANLQCYIKCNKLTKYDIDDMVEKGEIASFERTEKGKVKTYILTGEKINNKPYKITYIIKDHQSRVAKIESPKEALNCNCP